MCIDISNSTKRHFDIEYPYDVTLTKKDKEGFGFVVISSLNKGPTIGKYKSHLDLTILSLTIT